MWAQVCMSTHSPSQAAHMNRSAWPRLCSCRGLRHRGQDPAKALLQVSRQEDIDDLLARRGEVKASAVKEARERYGL